MRFDKFKLYILEILLLVILVLALFKSNIVLKSTLAAILVIYAFILKYGIKKRRILSIYNKQVIWLNVGFAVIYLALFYLLGLYFGYYKATVPFGLWSIMHFILPTAIIIIASEYIRFVLLSQKGKVNNVVSFISMTLIDILVYAQLYDVSQLDDFLTVFGFILFSSVSCNLLYNYLSARFGSKPIIIYRLITSLYAYVIPIIPDLFIFFRTIFRMIYPYIMYLIFEYTYSKNSKVSGYHERHGRLIGTTALIIFMAIVSMLVSCKFKYGILVIGSGSMATTIDKGDAILYESYKNQPINVGDIVIFNQNNSQIVHRVIKTEIVNKEYRYYTKGDANAQADSWYVTKGDIVGISKFVINYIGYPTLWVNEIFN